MESLSNWDVGGISLGCKTKAVRECTVVELKALLRLRGQKTSGLKAQLRNRLSANERRHPFRFLELPAEIRNEIYLWCAIIIESSSTATVASSDLTLEQIKNEDVIRQPVITRLCHQTRVEGLPIFYQQRRFLFQTQHDPNVHAHAISWLNRIDRQLGHTIRHIDFFHDNDDPIQGVQLFINSANLDVLKGATARFHFSQASLSKLRDLLGFFLQHLTRGGRRTGDGRMEMIGRLCDARGRNLFVGIQPTLTSLVVEFYPR